jgi:multiple sugar transport system substrate-binding protein
LWRSPAPSPRPSRKTSPSTTTKNGWEAGFEALANGASTASGIKIVPQLQTPTDRYQAFVQSSIAGGNTPPMFTWWNGKQLDSLVETGQIADLSAAWDKAIANGDFSEAEKALVSVDGVPYALPLNLARWPVLYRKDAFEKAGIAAPPQTWEEMLDAAEKLKAAGYTPFNAPNVGGWMGLIWFSELMIRTDPDAFVGLTDGSVPYNGPEVHRAFEIWVDFYERGYFTDPREQDDSRFFVNGDAAMWLIGEWAAGVVETKGLVPGRAIQRLHHADGDAGCRKLRHRRGRADRGIQAGHGADPGAGGSRRLSDVCRGRQRTGRSTGRLYR